MAEFAALAIDQDRHQYVVFRFERRVGVDIHHFDAEMRHTCLAAQGFQRSEQVVTQVAIVAAEQPQLRRRQILRGPIYRSSP